MAAVKKENIILQPLAVGYHKRSFLLLSERIKKNKKELVLTTSRDGIKFSARPKIVTLKTLAGELEDLNICHDYRFGGGDDNLVLTYLREGIDGPRLAFAGTKDCKTFISPGLISDISSAGILIPDLDINGLDVVYSSGHSLQITITKNLCQWEKIELSNVPTYNFFDNKKCSVFAAWMIGEQSAVLFGADITVDLLEDINLTDQKVGEQKFLKLGVAIFDNSDPTKLVHQTELPLFEIPIPQGESLQVIGLAPADKKKTSWRLYVSKSSGTIGFFDLSENFLFDQLRHKPVKLVKHINNPILAPSGYDWESGGTFNPAAVYLGGKVHLLYRAVGSNGYSCIGYASSSNGITVDERFSRPCYMPRTAFEGGQSITHGDDQGLFASGGSWGGCEDPKVTQIGDRIFMTYVAHNGYWPMRTALTSISVDDFLNHRWNWTRPVIMSPSGVGSKSVVILPEKINDHFVIFHRLWPNIVIDQVPDLSFGHNKRWLGNKFKIPPRRSYWDSQKLSMGSSPIKTEYGWLAIYNAVDRHDSSRYKIGAMLLDLDDPSKVIARLRQPILSPEEWYENEGKPGIAYPGGAVEIDDLLYVYYGGGDRVSCVATILTSELLDALLKDKQPNLTIHHVCS